MCLETKNQRFNPASFSKLHVRLPLCLFPITLKICAKSFDLCSGISVAGKLPYILHVEVPEPSVKIALYPRNLETHHICFFAAHCSDGRRVP